MKYLLFAVAMFGVVIVMGCSKKEEPKNIDATARSFVENLTSGKYQQAGALFDTSMAARLPADTLDVVWKSLTGQFGQFKGQGDTREETMNGFDIVYVTMNFEKSSIDARVVFDTVGQITGLFFVPTPTKEPYVPAEYVDQNAFEETGVTFGDSAWTLPGTLTMPKGKGPFRAVVLVGGSGPTDRDETIGPNKPFRDIAWGLASKGIAVFRYDKRTLVYKEKFANLPYYTVQEETIDDALAAVKQLKETDRIDHSKIFVLGHSMGGMLIPRIGMQSRGIAGFILMAAATRPIEDMIVDQTEYIDMLDGTMSKQEEADLKELKNEAARIKKLASDTALSKDNIILGAKSSYWLDIANYDPPDVTKAHSWPMLILQGERDYQVTKQDYENWEKALKSHQNVTFKLYPNLNHLFMAGEGKSTPDEYYKTGHVSQQVIDDIVNWINSI